MKQLYVCLPNKLNFISNKFTSMLITHCGNVQHGRLSKDILSVIRRVFIIIGVI